MSKRTSAAPSRPSVAASRLKTLCAAVKPLLEMLEPRKLFSAAPVARAGGPYTVNEGQSVLISGVTSTDADGTIATYQWDTNYSAAKGFHSRITGPTWSFTADNSGTRMIALKVTHNSGDTNLTTATINIADVAPTLTLTAPASADEASPVAVTWGYTDPGASDVVTAWSMDWGDGSAPAAYAGTAAGASHTYDADGDYTMTLTASQADGDFSTTHGITVNDVVPAVTGTTPNATVDEGQIVQMDFASPNRGGSLDGWTIDWGDGANDLFSASRSHATHVYADDGSYAATVKAQEPDGGFGSAVVNYTIRNVAPTVAITGTPATGVEGTALSFGSTVTDAGVNDTETLGWTVYRDGDHVVLPGGTDITHPNFTFTPTDNGSYVARLTVVDNDGGSTTVNSAPVIVANAAPTATLSATPAGHVHEGDAVSLTVTPADAGSEDTFTYAWTVAKDGAAFALPAGAVTNAATFSFTPTDDASYVATAVVTDDDGGSVSVHTAAVLVDNVAPTAAVTGAPATSPEGTDIAVAADAHDAGAADTLAYAWSVTKDGAAYDLGGTPVDGRTFAFRPADDGSYVIALTVTDDDGGTVSTTSGAIAVTDVAPTAVVSGDATGDEGSTLYYAVAPSDVGANDTAFTYAWSVTKDGVAYALPGSAVTDGPTFAFTPVDDGAYVVGVAVTDKDGGTGTATRSVAVADVKPAAAITGTPGTAPEGAAIALSSLVSDAGVDDTFAYAWSVARGGVAVDLTGVTTDADGFTFIPADNGSYVVTLVVTDNGGAARSVSTAAIVVTNVNPTATITGEPGSAVAEGSAVTLHADASDAGTEDTFAYAWTVTKDGAAFALPGGTAADAADFTFTPTDDGTYVATCGVTDDDGGATVIHSAAVVATNVAPVASINGTPDAHPVEGGTVGLFAGVSDAGTADTHTYAWSVAKDGQPYALPADVATTGATFAFVPTDNGSYVATLIVTDDDGASDTAVGTAITVDNVAPAGAISGPDASDEGTFVAVTAGVTDAGADDTISYAWSVTKDGSPVFLPLGTLSNAPEFDLTPDDQGTYAFACTATDKDGASTTLTHTLVVANVAPSVELTGVPDAGVEGAAITVGSTVSDPGVNDVLTADWTVLKDGHAYALPEGAVTDGDGLTFTPGDNGSYVVRLTVTDGDGSTTVDSTPIVVANAAPVVALTGATDGTEGQTVGLGETVADAGPDDTAAGFTYAWTVKKGTATVATGVAADFAFVPAVHGTYDVTLVVTDKDGLATTTATSIDVANVAPSHVAVGGLPDRVTEGDRLPLTISARDASGDAVTYDWTVFSGDTIIDAGDGAHFDFHPEVRGDYRIAVTATDTADAAASEDFDVTVANAAPAIAVNAPAGTVVLGAAATFGLAIGDVPVDQDLAVNWDFGDGATASAHYAGSQTAVRRHTYARRGTYVVTATVSDGQDTTTITKNVVVSEAVVQADPLDPTKTALFVYGSAANDTINVASQPNGKYAVTMNGETVGSAFAPTGRIVVYGNGGANTVNVTGPLGALVFAGGSTASNVTTGAGNDILVGTSAADRLSSGGGSDVILGGGGADTLRGGDGEDLLVAYGTNWVNDTPALVTLSQKWLAAGDVTARRAAVTATGLFRPARVIADNGSNQLYGEARNDWMLVNKATDRLKDVVKGDLVN